MSTIHWLGDEACHKETLVGGKAASLSRLAASHTVPAGFAIGAAVRIALGADPRRAVLVGAAQHVGGHDRRLDLGMQRAGDG